MSRHIMLRVWTNCEKPIVLTLDDPFVHVHVVTKISFLEAIRMLFRRKREVVSHLRIEGDAKAKAHWSSIVQEPTHPGYRSAEELLFRFDCVEESGLV